MTNKIKKRILLHLLFWLTYLLVKSLVYSFHRSVGLPELDFFIYNLLNEVFYIPAQALISIFIIYYLLPDFLFKKKYIYFFLLLCVSSFLFACVQILARTYIVEPLFSLAPDHPSSLFIFTIGMDIVQGYASVGIIVTIKLLKVWFINQRTQQKLETQKLESELKLLKGQIHPHFLFNTLNSLYGNAIKKSDELPEMILQLSSLLNYMLYECNVELVSVDKEIDYINNYIALEKQRYSDRLNIMLSKKGKSSDKLIAPLLLLPLIENSFKHGVSKTKDDAIINIDIKFGEDSMNFLIENTKGRTNDEKLEAYTEGIGLKNVKKRLELLYPDRHLLKISDKKSTFKVELMINVLKNSISNNAS